MYNRAILHSQRCPLGSATGPYQYHPLGPSAKLGVQLAECVQRAFFLGMLASTVTTGFIEG